MLSITSGGLPRFFPKVQPALSFKHDIFLMNANVIVHVYSIRIFTHSHQNLLFQAKPCSWQSLGLSSPLYYHTSCGHAHCQIERINFKPLPISWAMLPIYRQQHLRLSDREIDLRLCGNTCSTQTSIPSKQVWQRTVVMPLASRMYLHDYHFVYTTVDHSDKFQVSQSCYRAHLLRPPG